MIIPKVAYFLSSIFILLIILMASFVFFIALHDEHKKEDDWNVREKYLETLENEAKWIKKN